MADNEDKKPVYKKQLPLMDEVAAKQKECQHTLQVLNSGIIICIECSGVWIR